MSLLSFNRSSFDCKVNGINLIAMASDRKKSVSQGINVIVLEFFSILEALKFLGTINKQNWVVFEFVVFQKDIPYICGRLKFRGYQF